MSVPRVVDLGRISYAAAYELQLAHHEEVLAARASGTADPGRILLVEHDPPVITISRRPAARSHLTATPEVLLRAGVTVAETDRGGDITYHGPGQLVVYPILDLNIYHLGLHAYMRLLEQAIIDAIAEWGIVGERDAGATGVWVRGERARDQGIRGEGSREQGIKGSSEENQDAASALPSIPPSLDPSIPSSKIAALGVRVRRWVSMHGLALNVTTDLRHFDLIVPCGLVGRGVTSMQRELREVCPEMEQVKRVFAERLRSRLEEARRVPSAKESI